MPTEEQLRNELAELRKKYELKIQHFNALHSVAKHMKPEIREMSLKIDELEKKINKKSGANKV